MECDCTIPDLDGDGVPIKGCAQPGEEWDCDDTVETGGTRWPGNLEVCSPKGEAPDLHDEDCNPKTIGEDKDGDKYYNHMCGNADPLTGLLLIGLDCDDRNEEIHPGAKEECDEVDNNCNLVTDDVTDLPDVALHEYFRDEDGDGAGDPNNVFKTQCARPNPGYVTVPGDCNDKNPHANIYREEECDGFDNDCDKATDLPRVEGGRMHGDPHNGDGTKFECGGAEGWVVVECPPGDLDCGEKSSADRCETDGTTTTNCGECGRSCTFACGEVTQSGQTSYDCDEVAQVAVGAEHACARTTGGRATCWGEGDLGRLGNGAEADSFHPAWVVGLQDVIDIAAGRAHTCAIAGEARTTHCWGHNDQGELGDQTKTTRLLPTLVYNEFSMGELTGATQIAAGVAHTCVVRDDEDPYLGMVWCWGEPADDRLGNPWVLPGLVRSAAFVLDQAYNPLVGATRVAAGGAHSCAVTKTGEVGCWGSNASGQIGQAATIAKLDVFNVVTGVTGASDVVAGLHHSCALAAGKVWCWGDNSVGQLGRKTTTLGYIPEIVSGLDEVESIAAGEAFTCALRRSGEVLCWGLNYRGVVGSPSEVVLNPDPRSLGLNDIRHVAAGRGACAVGAQRATYCWGDNAHGQRANGRADNDDHPVPDMISSPLSEL